MRQRTLQLLHLLFRLRQARAQGLDGLLKLGHFVRLVTRDRLPNGQAAMRVGVSESAKVCGETGYPTLLVLHAIQAVNYALRSSFACTEHNTEASLFHR